LERVKGIEPSYSALKTAFAPVCSNRWRDVLAGKASLLSPPPTGLTRAQAAARHDISRGSRDEPDAARR